jgi:hypothetical protein
VAFWYGSGSAEPYLLLTNPDPVFFVRDLQEGKFFAKYFLEVHLHNFAKIKSHKEVTKYSVVGIEVFLTIFCLMIEGSGSIPLTTDPDPGDPKTYDADPQHCPKAIGTSNSIRPGIELLST